MTKFIKTFAQDESGAAASEYILLLALLGAGVAAGALYFGGQIKAGLTTKGDYLSSCAADKTGAACQ